MKNPIQHIVPLIKFNDAESAKERAETKPLSLPDEYQVMKIINDRLNGGTVEPITEEERKLLQLFVNHYQNLCHFKAVHVGLFATEFPERIPDHEHVQLFEITP